MAKLVKIRYQDGFYAAFNADVGELKQGDEIYLQLPDCGDSQHDSNYSSETAQKCIAIIDDIYSDEQLSIMSIIEDTDLSDFEIRNCELSSIETDDQGDLNNINWSIQILKKGSNYYPIKESNIHKYYTNRFAWQINDDAELRFDDSELIKAFDLSDDIEQTGSEFDEEVDLNSDLELAKELPIEHFKSADSKGFYIKELNRELTIADIEKADSLMVCVDTGTQHPFYCKVDKSYVIERLSDSTRPVIKRWYYSNNKLDESIIKPKGRYDIIIGDRITEYV